MAWAGPNLLGTATGTASALSQVVTGITASIGDLVIVSGGAFTATAAASITMTDSAGNAYTPCLRTKTNAGNVNCWIFFSVLTAALVSGTITVTGTNNLIDWRMGVVSFTGQAVSPEDTACRASLNNGGTTSPTVTSGTPSVSGDLMIAASAGNNATSVTYTEDATWTNLYNGNQPSVAFWGFAYQINAGSGTKTYNPTIGTSIGTTALITGFKVATGGAAFNPGWASGATKTISAVF